ncbi:lipid droplet-regulating VLDL assembly factor AUP1 [Spea bombifrons]|uniref:lipid droplet-regulating VLDL assembly factor AUP1 n=1 Tax=Spea bombifrons TaxID=233779 RepID=UPI002349B42F|nr:lipid droplet-regulating VLDL assembly factor AUP1 [Spea bombifrons]XP_053313979.1 lipid droplet-regulating VLDL assembly factor AUP1 [Spea bombifrons]
MAAPALDSMLGMNRFPEEPLSLVLLVLYAPVGLCLFLLRLFIGAHVFLVSCVLPESDIRRCLTRAMSLVLGVVVLEAKRHARDPAVKICVSNHRTYFDHSVMRLLTSCATPSVSCPPGFLCWARGFLELGAPGSRSQLQESLKHYLSHPGSLSLLLFPEEETTSGKTGLLRFSSWAFSLSDAVQPLALGVQRPLVSPAVSGSPWYVELFWTLFVPYTVYQVRWLPSVSRSPGESDEDFASRVQKLIAASLGVLATGHTAADRAEHLKRRKRDPPAPSVATSAESQMAKRVKEVLPQVPLSVILKDLARTGCVDTTITNLLEGHVPFASEEGASGRSGGSALTSPNLPPKSVYRGFARRPEERHLSLQERKEALYESARRRYLLKFGGRHTAED